MTTKEFVVLLLAAMLTACASTPKSKFGPVSASTRAALQASATLDVEVVPGKGLSQMTGGDRAKMMTGVLFGAIGGAIGAAAAISSANRHGAELQKASALDDPSRMVAARLRQRLQAESRVIAPNAPVRLELTTTNWALAIDDIAYFSRLRVLDTRTGQSMASGECKYLRKGKELGVSSDQLLADSASRLKQEYEKAADYCATYFFETLFVAKA